MNNYELNAQALLESKRLDAESKKDIGTIRRYGVGADVIIMYGGIKNELDEENESPNYSEIAKYLRRTGDALDEVIAICNQMDSLDLTRTSEYRYRLLAFRKK